MTIQEITSRIRFTRYGDESINPVTVVGLLSIRSERQAWVKNQPLEQVFQRVEQDAVKDILRQLYDDTSTDLMGCIVSLEQCHPNNHETRQKIINQMKKLALATFSRAVLEAYDRKRGDPFEVKPTPQPL